MNDQEKEQYRRGCLSLVSVAAALLKFAVTLIVVVSVFCWLAR